MASLRMEKSPASNDPVVVFLVLYVDDILLIENDIPVLQKIKVWLSS